MISTIKVLVYQVVINAITSGFEPAIPKKKPSLPWFPQSPSLVVVQPGEMTRQPGSGMSSLSAVALQYTDQEHGSSWVESEQKDNGEL